MTADRVAAIATAIGIGLLALMLTWIVAARAAAILWPSPGGFVAALATACIAGTAVAIGATHRLIR